jgi:hypothetical protein
MILVLDTVYTDQMRRVVHNLIPPKGFGVDIIDNEHFLTIRINERQFVNITHDEKIAALQYVIQLKNALEKNGAIILVTREAIK